MDEITVSQLKARRDAGDDIQLIDVREPDEFGFANIDGSTLIPLGTVITRMDEIDPERETVVMCKAGGSGARAIDALKQRGFEGKLSNLVGGITAWSDEIDPAVRKY